MAGLPDRNLFMRCPEPEPDAFAPFPTGFTAEAETAEAETEEF